jgi:hypothetical protein
MVARELGQLHQELAEAARRGGHQHDLVASHLSGAFEGQQRGHRGGAQRDVLRGRCPDRHRIGDVRHQPFAVARTEARRRHRVTGAQRGDAGTDLDDGTDRLHPQIERRNQIPVRQLTAGHDLVEQPVDADIGVPDEHLTGTRRSHRLPHHARTGPQRRPEAIQTQ